MGTIGNIYAHFNHFYHEIQEKVCTDSSCFFVLFFFSFQVSLQVENMNDALISVYKFVYFVMRSHSVIDI